MKRSFDYFGGEYYGIDAYEKRKLGIMGCYS